MAHANRELDNKTRQDGSQARMADNKAVLGLGMYLIIVGTLAANVLAGAWPTILPGEPNGGWDRKFKLFCFDGKLEHNTRLIILAFAVGALGSFIQAARSFIAYVGNRTFQSNWIWWYVMRPFIGGGLGLLFYLLFRGGLVTGANGDPSNVINPYAVMAICGLAGLFSNRATTVLGRVFNALFKTETEEDQAQTQLKDKLYPIKRSNPVPGIEHWDPETLPAGDKSAELTVHGRGFVKGAVVKLDGSQTDTQYVSDKELTAKLLALNLATPGTVQLMVSNPEPGGGESKPIKLKVSKQ